MTYLSRCFVLAALVCGASTAFASSVAPNVQVTVKQGRTTVFKGLTDGSGRFTTVPVPPGVYTFELRALKTAPPAQYFLLLSGAKPVTAPIADKKAVLMMDAQVRTPRSVTGQVTARRFRIIAPVATEQATTGNPGIVGTRAPAPAATPLPGDMITRSVQRAPAPATPTRVTARVANPAPTPRVSSQSAVGARAMRINRVAARNVAAAAERSNSAAARGAATKPAPVQAPTPSGRLAGTRTSAPATPAPARPVAYQRRMINGKPHIWVPMAPGSRLGRWMPETR